MQYFIFQNPDQDEDLSSLLEQDENIVSEDDLDSLIKASVKDIRTNYPKLTEKFYLYPLFESINQVSRSYKKYQETKTTTYFSENPEELSSVLEELFKEEEAMLLVFFINAKAFCEMVKKFTNSKKIPNGLYSDISTLRNYLVHSYEKLIESQRFFVRVSKERGLRDHSVLQIHEIDSGRRKYQIHFSLKVIYFGLKDVFETLKKDPTLFV